MSRKRGKNASLATPVPGKGSGAPAKEGKASSWQPAKRAHYFGLVRRQEKWVLSGRGRCVALLSLVLLAWGFVAWVHGFLAVTDRVDAKYLVVEGWLPNYALQDSITEFKSKPYEKIFTVGADPLTGLKIEDGDSLAIEAYKRLLWLGMSADLVQAVPAHIKYRDRTFQSALALKKWIDENHVPVTSINVVTLGPHARRSRLLFEEAFGSGTSVGIISVENREYDPKRWWKYSEGVKELLGEGVGYLYARFVFHPKE